MASRSFVGTTSEKLHFMSSQMGNASVKERRRQIARRKDNPKPIKSALRIASSELSGAGQGSEMHGPEFEGNRNLERNSFHQREKSCLAGKTVGEHKEPDCVMPVLSMKDSLGFKSSEMPAADDKIKLPEKEKEFVRNSDLDLCALKEGERLFVEGKAKREQKKLRWIKGGPSNSLNHKSHRNRGEFAGNHINCDSQHDNYAESQSGAQISNPKMALTSLEHKQFGPVQLNHLNQDVCSSSVANMFIPEGSNPGDWSGCDSEDYVLTSSTDGVHGCAAQSSEGEDHTSDAQKVLQSANTSFCYSDDRQNPYSGSTDHSDGHNVDLTDVSQTAVDMAHDQQSRCSGGIGSLQNSSLMERTSINNVSRDTRKLPSQGQTEVHSDDVSKNLSGPSNTPPRMESQTPSATQLVVPGQGLEERLEVKEPLEDRGARLLVRKVITDNTIFLDTLSKYLDRESRAIKCWKHLAYVLGVPSEKTREFHLYTERSPTEDLFSYLAVRYPNLTVDQLKAALRFLHRNDVVQSLEKGNYNGTMKTSDLFLRDPRFIALLSSQLDMDSRSIGNWRKLGAYIRIPKTKLDQFGQPPHGPTAMLFRYLETTSSIRDLTMGQLRGHFTAMERNDVVGILDKHNVDDSAFVRHTLKADSELLEEISDRLNKEMRAVKNWRNLAFRLQIPYEVYDTFDTSKGEAKSPTKFLFEWLATYKPLCTVEELLDKLEKIERRDVVELITEETKKVILKEDLEKSVDFEHGAALQQLTITTVPTSIRKVCSDLKELQDETDQLCRKTDLGSDLEDIARTKGFVISHNPGNGDCMFYALADQLKLVKGISLTHFELRRKLVAFLEKQHKLADGTDLMHFANSHSSWSEYLEELKSEGTWGDHLVLVAAANCFDVVIRVVSSLPHHNDIFIYPEIPVHSGNPLVLGHVHEEHYVSLHRVKPDGAQFPRLQNSEDSHMVSLGNRDVPTADPQQMESCQKRSSLLAKDLPFLVYSKVCTMLDYKRDFFDDFRMLAEGLGIDRDYIRLLEQKDNPTYLIFSNYNQTLKVGQLIEALKRIERLDVVEVLEDWVQNKDKA